MKFKSKYLSVFKLEISSNRSWSCFRANHKQRQMHAGQQQRCKCSSTILCWRRTTSIGLLFRWHWQRCSRSESWQGNSRWTRECSQMRRHNPSESIIVYKNQWIQTMDWPGHRCKHTKSLSCEISMSLNSNKITIWKKYYSLWQETHSIEDFVIRKGLEMEFTMIKKVSHRKFNLCRFFL